jgi:hypothetical protein
VREVLQRGSQCDPSGEGIWGPLCTGGCSVDGLELCTHVEFPVIAHLADRANPHTHPY